MNHDNYPGHTLDPTSRGLSAGSRDLIKSVGPADKPRDVAKGNAVTNHAVFISDLHLDPKQPAISQRFEAFIQWAATRTKAVYILGDFFNAWPGDDGMTTWSEAIADRLAWLSSQQVKLYFMPGNRDFLLGQRFLQRANMQQLSESSIIHLDDEPILLVHGDRYCTRDKSHQWLRRLTRNRVFTRLFLSIPYRFRASMVTQVREYSQSNSKPSQQMMVVPEALVKQLRQLKVKTVIHGHIHQPGTTQYDEKDGRYRQYVLSDWDEMPLILCYNNTNHFYFEPLKGELL